MAAAQFKPGNYGEAYVPSSMDDDLNIIDNQTGRYCGHNNSFYDDKQRLYLQISEGMIFVGWLVKKRNQYNRYENHQKFHAVVYRV